MINRMVFLGPWPKRPPHSLSERIARFAMAINGCSAQNVSKSYWEQAKEGIGRRTGHGP